MNDKAPDLTPQAAWLLANREGIIVIANRTGMSIAEVEAEYAKVYRDQIEAEVS